MNHLDDENTGKALTETVDKLYKQAGMTRYRRAGLCHRSSTITESIAYRYIPLPELSPDLTYAIR